MKLISTLCRKVREIDYDVRCFFFVFLNEWAETNLYMAGSKIDSLGIGAIENILQRRRQVNFSSSCSVANWINKKKTDDIFSIKIYIVFKYLYVIWEFVFCLFLIFSRNFCVHNKQQTFYWQLHIKSGLVIYNSFSQIQAYCILYMNYETETENVHEAWKQIGVKYEHNKQKLCSERANNKIIKAIEMFEYVISRCELSNR